MGFRLTFCALATTLALIGGGCSSIFDAHSVKEELVTAYRAGNLEAAEELLSGKVSSHEDTGDEVMWLLEYGYFSFYTGNFTASLRAFNRAHDLIEAFDERADVSARDVGSEGGAALTNANALPYRGMYRDRIFLNIYSALAALGADDEDAFYVYINRMRREMGLVEEKFAGEIQAEKEKMEKAKAENAKEFKAAKISAEKSVAAFTGNEELRAQLAPTRAAARPEYGNLINPLALYLSGFALWQENDTGNALVEFRKLYEAFPESAAAQQLYSAALAAAGEEAPDDLPPPPDFPVTGNVVCVLFANGLGPALKDVTIHFALPFSGYTGIAFPVCEFHDAPYSSPAVTADGATVPLEEVASVDAIAANEYGERLTLMITRLVINYLTKEAATIAINEAARASGSDAVYLLTVAGTSTYKYAFNTADTRCWELAPKEFYAALIPMPQSRELTISAAGMPSCGVRLPPDAQSAICYIAAPGGNAQIRVIPLKLK